MSRLLVLFSVTVKMSPLDLGQWWQRFCCGLWVHIYLAIWSHARLSGLDALHPASCLVPPRLKWARRWTYWHGTGSINLRDQKTLHAGFFDPVQSRWRATMLHCRTYVHLAQVHVGPKCCGFAEYSSKQVDEIFPNLIHILWKLSAQNWPMVQIFIFLLQIEDRLLWISPIEFSGKERIRSHICHISSVADFALD